MVSVSVALCDGGEEREEHTVEEVVRGNADVVLVVRTSGTTGVLMLLVVVGRVDVDVVCSSGGVRTGGVMRGGGGGGGGGGGKTGARLFLDQSLVEQGLVESAYAVGVCDQVGLSLELALAGPA